MFNDVIFNIFLLNKKMQLRFLSLFIALFKNRLANRIKCLSNHPHLGETFSKVNETRSGFDARFNDIATIQRDNLHPRSNFVKRGILNNLLDDNVTVYNKLILIDKTGIFSK